MWYSVVSVSNSQGRSRVAFYDYQHYQGFTLSLYQG